MKPKNYILLLLPAAVSAVVYFLVFHEKIGHWLVLAQVDLALVLLYGWFIYFLIKFLNENKAPLLPLLLVVSKFAVAWLLMTQVLAFGSGSAERMFFILSYLIFLFFSVAVIWRQLNPAKNQKN